MIFLKKVDYPFLWQCAKLIFQKLFHRIFQNILYLSLLSGSHYEKLVQLTCIVIGLEVLDDGPIFSGIARRQERGSFICKHRRTKEEKMKVYIFVDKIFTNSFLKVTQPLQCDTMPWQSQAVAKWHRFFLFFNSLVINTVITAFSIYTGEIVGGHCTEFSSSIGT